MTRTRTTCPWPGCHKDWKAGPGPDGEYGRTARRITEYVLAEIAATSQAAGATPDLVYLPALDEITSPKPLLDGERFLLCVGETHGIDCFSARPHFTAKVAQGEVFNTDAHWGPAGHLTAAEAIYQHLVAQTGMLSEEGALVDTSRRTKGNPRDSSRPSGT